RVLWRRGGLRAVAQAVPRARRGRLAARGEGDPQYLGRHDQRPRRDTRRATDARRPHGLASERGDPMTVTWRTVPAAARTLGRWITIVQLVGYTTSLLFVWHTTRLVPPGIEARYRGADPQAAEGGGGEGGVMRFPKSFAGLLTIIDTDRLLPAVSSVACGRG